MSDRELRQALEQASSGQDLEERCRGVERLAALPGDAATDALTGLLGESSWYLRERVVEALRARPEAGARVARSLHDGEWFARASACDVLGPAGDAEAIGEVLTEMEHRNVSLQKSAAAALRRLARVHGAGEVARRVAHLPRERRRRVLVRIGHQEPAFAGDLERALSDVPESERVEPEVSAPPALAPGSERELVRFRRWLAHLPVPEGPA